MNKPFIAFVLFCVTALCVLVGLVSEFGLYTAVKFVAFVILCGLVGGYWASVSKRKGRSVPFIVFIIASSLFAHSLLFSSEGSFLNTLRGEFEKHIADSKKDRTETWRGLTVAPEHRCSPYDADDYPYSQSVERRIATDLGSIYSPYTGQVFADLKQTHIEHIVALSEAHDSGLCAATAETRCRFASDLLNLTLASPEVNGCGTGGKCAKDAAEWLPRQNLCWFANRVLEVKRKYDLTIDRREAAALERVLASCESTAMIGPADD